MTLDDRHSYAPRFNEFWAYLKQHTTTSASLRATKADGHLRHHRHAYPSLASLNACGTRSSGSKSGMKRSRALRSILALKTDSQIWSKTCQLLQIRATSPLPRSSQRVTQKLKPFLGLVMVGADRVPAACQQKRTFVAALPSYRQTRQ